MDDAKRCFSYCGDDKCDCPARGFDHSLPARVAELERRLNGVDSRVRHHDLMNTVFGGKRA